MGGFGITSSSDDKIEIEIARKKREHRRIQAKLRAKKRKEAQLELERQQAEQEKREAQEELKSAQEQAENDKQRQVWSPWLRWIRPRRDAPFCVPPSSLPDSVQEAHGKKVDGKTERARGYVYRIPAGTRRSPGNYPGTKQGAQIGRAGVGDDFATERDLQGKSAPVLHMY